jgi:hypothetical protein
MIWKAKTPNYWVSTDQGELQTQVIFIADKGYAAWRVQDNGKTVEKGRADSILTGMNISCTALLKYKANKNKIDAKLSKVEHEDFVGLPEFISTESNF